MLGGFPLKMISSGHGTTTSFFGHFQSMPAHYFHLCGVNTFYGKSKLRGCVFEPDKLTKTYLLITPQRERQFPGTVCIPLNEQVSTGMVTATEGRSSDIFKCRLFMWDAFKACYNALVPSLMQTSFEIQLLHFL